MGQNDKSKNNEETLNKFITNIRNCIDSYVKYLKKYDISQNPIHHLNELNHLHDGTHAICTNFILFFIQFIPPQQFTDYEKREHDIILPPINTIIHALMNFSDLTEELLQQLKNTKQVDKINDNHIYWIFNVKIKHITRDLILKLNDVELKLVRHWNELKHFCNTCGARRPSEHESSLFM